MLALKVQLWSSLGITYLTEIFLSALVNLFPNQHLSLIEPPRVLFLDQSFLPFIFSPLGPLFINVASCFIVMQMIPKCISLWNVKKETLKTFVGLKEILMRGKIVMFNESKILILYPLGPVMWTWIPWKTCKTDCYQLGCYKRTVIINWMSR